MHMLFPRASRTPLFLFALILTISGSMQGQSIQLSKLGEYKTGVYDASSAEIVAHDPVTQRLFIVRGDAPVMDIISVINPATPTFVANIDIAALWPAFGGANSVAVKNGIVAVAAQANPKTDPGRVYFFDASGNYLHHVTVGALPDMLTFTADEQRILVANEGEPNDAYTIDPEGSVSVIDLTAGVTNATVATAGFSGYNAQINTLRASGVRIYGPGASVAQDLEPEYITTQGNTAWVSLQENNALAIIDIANATVTDIVPLGTKDHSVAGNGLDASDKDNAINIATWPVRGMYQPDAVASVVLGGQTYVVMANEGDARDYAGFAEEVRMKDATVDAGFPNLASLRNNARLGRLNITRASGDTDGDGDLDALYSFGGRSFSIRAADGTLIWDSGDDFEEITAAAYPAYFNASNTDSDFDSRSDNKGPEPEALTLATICGSTYAFVGLERVGGIMVYDISNPATPVFQQYINNRDFTQTPGAGTVNAIGDLGPEGLIFIPAAESPNGQNLLACASEVSGTVTLFSIRNTTPPTVSAALTMVNRINASKGDFRVDVSAEDGCDPVPALTAVINIPSLRNPQLSFSIDSDIRVKFDPAKNRVSVQAPNPAQFWAEIVAAGGIPVADGDVFEFQQLANYDKFDFDFNSNGDLQKVKAATATLTATAVDASWNSVTVTAVPAFSKSNNAAAAPASPILEQNYPNPFNPSTTIRFSLPAESRISLRVHDLLGRHIATLVDGVLSAGSHAIEWTGNDDAGAVVPSGLYLYTLRAGDVSVTRRMLLSK
ncbi:MAG: choice-of-anchor I family protein [Bacteroidetes bacterium]|nr:choice-of-anchor I family protein [Bacteroidota bacterium]